MDEKIEEVLQRISLYAKVECWVSLKKEILREISAEKRKLFSTRDSKTKKQNINSFEESVIARWKEISGVDLYLDRQ